MSKLGLGLSREGLLGLEGAERYQWCSAGCCWGWVLQQQWRTPLLLKRAEPQG